VLNNHKKTSLLLLSCILTHVYASSSSNTKNYCEPNDLTKYKPTPTQIVSPNLEKFEDAIESGIIKGSAADTSTLKLNESPYNIFALTVEEATRIARKANQINSDKIMNTSSVIGTSIKPLQIVYDVNYITTAIIKNIMSPINSAAQSDGSLSFPGIAKTSDNSSTAQQNSINSQNTTDLTGNITYNDIINDFVGVDPTTPQFNNGSLSIDQLDLNVQGYKLLADGCSYTMPPPTTSSTTSSSSTATDSTSQLSTPPAGSGITGGSNSNTIKKSLRQCSAAVGACILNSTQKTLIPLIITYLDGFSSSSSTDTKDYNQLYSETVEKVNKIADEDLSEFGTSTGMSFPTSCLDATCSGSNCASASDVQTELGTFSSMLGEVDDKLQKMLAIKIKNLLAKNVQSKTTTENSYKDQKYFINMGYSLGGIISLSSFGIPDSSKSPLQCSTKSKYLSASLAAISSNLIDRVDKAAPAPAYMVDDLSLGTNSIAVAGGFGSIQNQNNVANYSTNIPLMLNERTKAENTLKLLKTVYNKSVKSFIAQKSLALQNLREMISKRSELHKVPLIYNTLELNYKCQNGINSATSESDCQFQDPFSNITTDWNLESGQICSLQELENMEATWRQQPGPNNSINPWQQQIKYSSATEVSRAKLLLLAEVKDQIYQNKNLRDKILAANASSMITSLTDSKLAMENLLMSVKSAEKSYITGSSN